MASPAMNGCHSARTGNSVPIRTDKAASVTTKLDEISKRLTTLDDRTKELEELDKRIQGLKDAARQAEQTTQKAIGPDGELRKHREAVQQLSSQALQTRVISNGGNSYTAIASTNHLSPFVLEKPIAGAATPVRQSFIPISFFTGTLVSSW